jgi:hypothetical protein
MMMEKERHWYSAPFLFVLSFSLVDDGGVILISRKWLPLFFLPLNSVLGCTLSAVVARSMTSKNIIIIFVNPFTVNLAPYVSLCLVLDRQEAEEKKTKRRPLRVW